MPIIFWHDSGLDRYGKFSLIFYTSASFFFKCLNYINLSNCKFLKLVLKFYLKKFIRLHFCNLDINSDFKIQLTIKHNSYPLYELKLKKKIKYQATLYKIF